MNRSRPLGFFPTVLVSAALSACLVVVVFGATSTNAGRQTQRHGAVTQEVSVDGELVRAGEGWVIRLKAINGGAKDQDCKVAASLTSVRSSMMARAMPSPKEIWKSTVALKVPAKGESAQQAVEIPTDIAKRMNPPKADPKKPEDIFVGHERFDVRFQASCEDEKPDTVS